MEQEQPEQKPRERSFMRELVPDWRPTRKQVLWTIRIVVVLVVIVGFLTLIGLPFAVTLWDWLDLLIVPAVLALGAYLFARSENRRAQEIADQRTVTDREIADQSRQDDTLQAYFDVMGQLLLDKDRPLRQSVEGDEARTLARARTLTALGRLDPSRKRNLLLFLYESGLVGVLGEKGEAVQVIVTLSGADLRYSELRGAIMAGANLSQADLRGADLTGAMLCGPTPTGYRRINLSLARLGGATLTAARLEGADLSDAVLAGAVLIGAHLREGDLSNADVKEADSSAANLEGADLVRLTKPRNG